jgi:hypothetical protein
MHFQGVYDRLAESIDSGRYISFLHFTQLAFSRFFGPHGDLGEATGHEDGLNLMRTWRHNQNA